MQDIPKTQTAAVVEKLGGEVVFRHDWPVPMPGKNEVLAKVLYTGVCQSGMFMVVECTNFSPTVTRHEDGRGLARLP